MVIVPGVMTMYPGVAVNTLKEVIALAKAKPDALNYGSPGPLTSGHLSMELLKLKAGINITHIPYKGGAPAIIDLVGGRIQFLISGPPGVLPHIKAGRLKAIATTAAKRSPGLPDTPTFAESGMLNGATDKAQYFDLVERTRGRFAQLIGADAEEIAYAKNISEGLNMGAKASRPCSWGARRARFSPTRRYRCWSCGDEPFRLIFS